MLRSATPGPTVRTSPPSRPGTKGRSSSSPTRDGPSWSSPPWGWGTARGRVRPLTSPWRRPSTCLTMTPQRTPSRCQRGVQSCCGSCLILTPPFVMSRGPVTQIDDELRAKVREMFDLMYEARGIGLAANQVALALPVLRPEPDGRPRAEGPGAGLHQPRDRQAALVDRGRGGVPELPRPLLPRSSAPGRSRSSAFDLDGQPRRDRRRRPVQPGDPARDRPPRRQALHRLARPDSRRHSVDAKLREFESQVPPGPGRGEYPDDDEIVRQLDELASQAAVGSEAADSPNVGPRL